VAIPVFIHIRYIPAKFNGYMAETDPLIKKIWCYVTSPLYQPEISALSQAGYPLAFIKTDHYEYMLSTYTFSNSPTTILSMSGDFFHS
jgi:hypothetical protein